MTAPCSVIKTHHLDHIFGIKFIPLRDNKIIVTGATDAAVEVHTLADDLRSRINSNLLYCHKAAINYIEVEHSSPNLFFSVGDDSCVRQYDLRIKMMGCQSEESMTIKTGSMYRSPNCLLRCKDKMGINSMKIDRVNTNMVTSIDNSIMDKYMTKNVFIFYSLFSLQVRIEFRFMIAGY